MTIATQQSRTAMNQNEDGSDGSHSVTTAVSSPKSQTAKSTATSGLSTSLPHAATSRARPYLKASTSPGASKHLVLTRGVPIVPRPAARPAPAVAQFCNLSWAERLSVRPKAVPRRVAVQAEISACPETSGHVSDSFFWRFFSTPQICLPEITTSRPGRNLQPANLAECSRDNSQNSLLKF